LIDFSELHDSPRNTNGCLSIPAQADEDNSVTKRNNCQLLEPLRISFV